MSNQPNDGGPAYPCVTMHDFKGMSLRDFKGMSLRDFIAINATPQDANRWQQILGEQCNWSATPTIEQAKYAYADAMLKARQQIKSE